VIERAPAGDLRTALALAATRLAEAGVPAAWADAQALAAHALGVSRAELLRLTVLGGPTPEGLAELVARRVAREPLQHITGRAAFRGLDLQVGPGVFIPRPETESLLEWAVAQPLSRRPLIVDLCTGSGALAVALSKHWPDARIVAVDDSEDALGYARRNTAGTPVELIQADVTQAGLLAELDDQVDLVVANPPYIPDGAALEPEVAEHDPPHALFGGPDGMAVIDRIVELAARLLRDGGRCGVEHDDTTSARTVEAFTRTGRFVDVTAREDLTGRPRFVTARRERLTS